MTSDEFEDAMNLNKLDSEYAEFISAQRTICNGTQLLAVMERGDYYEDFKNSLTEGN